MWELTLDNLPSRFSIWKLDTGDHHSQYDIYMLIDRDLVPGVLVDLFRHQYPFRCREHSYEDDAPSSCDDCWVQEERTTAFLAQDGLDSPDRGFWNGPFASWLVREYDAVILTCHDVCVVSTE